MNTKYYYAQKYEQKHNINMNEHPLQLSLNNDNNEEIYAISHLLYYTFVLFHNLVVSHVVVAFFLQVN